MGQVDGSLEVVDLRRREEDGRAGAGGGEELRDGGSIVSCWIGEGREMMGWCPVVAVKGCQ